MNSRRIYYVLCGIVILLVGAIIGGAWLANQQLKQQASQLANYKAQSEVLSQEQTGLVKAKQDVAKYQSLERIARSVVPQDKDQAQTVREIIAVASASGIKPTAITFPASNLDKNGVATSSGGLSQLTPVKGISGVYNLQITVQQDATSPVSYDKFINFLDRLEQNRRTAQVSGIVLQPSVLNKDQVSFSLTINEYIKP